MSVPTVAELIEDLAAMIVADTDILPGPTLHLIDESGQMMVVHLNPVGEKNFSPVARLVVARQDPLVAVLAVMARTAITQKSVEEESDPEKKRLLRGEISIGQLPPDSREQMLMMYGEDRAGNQAVKMWRAADKILMPGMKKRFVPFETEVVEVMHSRMTPFYMFRELMAEKGLSEHQARKLAREQATKELARMGMREQQVMPPPSDQQPFRH